MAKRRCARLTSERDISLLVFLWKWKVASASLLIKKFFPTVSGYTAYRRLWALEKGGYITAIADRTGIKFLWTLTKLGSEAAKEKLGVVLAEDGFKSEHPGHDLLTMALQLGDLALGGSQVVVKSFSEQQLRRYHKEDYPDYVPQIGQHRADGYSHIAGASGGRTVAFEVELHVKDKHFYYDVSSHFTRSEIDCVLWLVPTLSSANRITKYMSEYRGHNGHNKAQHGFVILHEFINQGWAANIRGGKYDGKTIANIFQNEPQMEHQNSPQTARKPVCTALSLNLCKSPHKSTTYKIYEFGNFAN